MCSHSMPPIGRHARRATNSGSPSRITAIVCPGARRRSVGLPGFTIQTPSVPRDLRHVAVAVGDDVAAGEELPQALVPADSRAAVVDEPDRSPSSSAVVLTGRDRAKLAVVHVPRTATTGPKRSRSARTEAAVKSPVWTMASAASRIRRQSAGRERAPAGGACLPEARSEQIREELAVPVDELAVRVDFALATQVADRSQCSADWFFPPLSGYAFPSAMCTVPPSFSSKSVCPVKSWHASRSSRTRTRRAAVRRRPWRASPGGSPRPRSRRLDDLAALEAKP